MVGPLRPVARLLLPLVSRRIEPLSLRLASPETGRRMTSEILRFAAPRTGNSPRAG